MSIAGIRTRSLCRNWKEGREKLIHRERGTRTRSIVSSRRGFFRFFWKTHCPGRNPNETYSSIQETITITLFSFLFLSFFPLLLPFFFSFLFSHARRLSARRGWSRKSNVIFPYRVSNWRTMPSKISLSQFLTKDVGDWFCKRPVIFVYRSLPRKETVLDFILDEIFREIVKFLGKDRSWRRIRTEYRNFVSGPNITRRVFLSRHLFFFTFNNCSVITSHSLSLSLSLSFSSSFSHSLFHRIATILFRAPCLWKP